MRVVGFGFVIELLRDEVAQTQNPILFCLNPYYCNEDGLCRLDFLFTHSPLRNRRKCEGRLHWEWGHIYDLLS